MRLASLVLPLSALLACSPASDPQNPRHSVPQVSGVSADGSEGTASRDSRGEGDASRPRITVEAQDATLQVLVANLDADPEEEQVIAVKRRDDLDAPVRMIVADSDASQGQYYFQSWESETHATNGRILDLSVMDLVGDHGREIVVSGINREGRLTLDVFRTSTAQAGKGLTFRPICQVAADEIRIEESERDEAYTLGSRNGLSFPIVTYLRDPESANVMDLIRITYSWKYSENRYVPGAPEKIPGEKVEQKQLEKLFTNGTVSSFEDFLSGSWVQLSPTPGGERVDSIVDVQPRDRRISISTGDTQEVYIWRDTLRTIYNRVILIGENESVAKITKTFSISVESASSIAVSIQGSDLGDFPLATYTKVSEDIQARLLARPGVSVRPAAAGLAGAYSGASHLVLDFSNPRIVWTDAGRSQEGSYVVYTLQGRTILAVRLLRARQSGSESRSYLADYREKREASRLVRTLVLTPVLVTVKGYEETTAASLTLVQTQDLPKK